MNRALIRALSVPIHFWTASVIAVFHASAATTPNAAVASEIMVATYSRLKRVVWCTTRPTTARPPGAASSPSFSERGSSVRTEGISGLATFLTMAYILFVNPAILGAITDGQGTQLPFDQVLTVTALVAGFMTILMGVYGKYPFALAAGLGLNAFVAFTLVAADKLTWPQAMGVVVAEGLVISALVLTGFREAVLNAIPMDLKRAIGIGIG